MNVAGTRMTRLISVIGTVVCGQNIAIMIATATPIESAASRSSRFALAECSAASASVASRRPRVAPDSPAGAGFRS
jgi:hypothetical protein